MRRSLVLAISAMAALTTGAAANGDQGAPPSAVAKDIPTLTTQTTEEGQTVIYDRYTWQRRELAKRLPIAEPWPSEFAIGDALKRYKLDTPPIPALLPLPARIMTDVYLVNSEPNLVYLIDAGADGLVLVDPGLTMNVLAIVKNIEMLGFSASRVKWVINTHAHFDHSMADAAFQKMGAKILVGRDDVPAVEKGTLYTGKWAFPALTKGEYPTLKVDWPVDDGEELKLGNKTFVAIKVPGHTPGSTCYWLKIGDKNVLFGGDTILFDYRLGANPPTFSDASAYLASLRKLAFYGFWPTTVRWDVLLPGHGTMVLDRAYMDVLKGYQQVELNVADNTQVQALPFATDNYRRLMFGRP
ncbi:MAG: MBL fold metallo-hydrolase [Sphingomonas sp.]|uniref:MBL fold metallo-hydrolase n=1 Tax=Sphingomonas sp. TaxID=28214 RepID=UPI001AD2A3A7|nr:MBL fold metallo-hydrolase [Sphingomonas sp.]MBN8807106.1 MBL fold metallo-hydrolase [Sphingomonas sp.]